MLGKLVAFAILVAHLPAAAGSSSASLLPTDKKASEWSPEDLEDYGESVLARTAYLGVLIAGLFGLLECICCIYCCCASSPSKAVNKKKPRHEQLLAFNDRLTEKLPGTKGFYIGSMVFWVALVACLFGVFGYWDNYKTAMMDTFDGTYSLSTGFAGFLCSEDYSPTCADYTVGGFLQDAKEVAGDTFDSVSTYLEGLDNLTQGLEGSATELDNSMDTLAEMDNTLDRIDGNVTAVNAILDDLAADPSVPTEVKDSLPAEIDGVDDQGLIADATNAMMDAHVTVTDVIDGYTTYYDNEVVDLLERIDGDPNTAATDDRLELFDTIDNILDEILDIRDTVLDRSKDMDDAKPTYALIFNTVAMGITLFFALPAIISLLTVSFAKCCTCVCPVYTGMGFTYFCQTFFCVAAGVTLFFAFLWDDVCVVHEDLIEVTLGNYTTEIGDSTVNIGGNIMNILKCGHNSQSNVDQNLAAILGIEDEFDVTEYVDPVIEEMYDVRTYILNQTHFVEQAMDEVDAVMEGFANYDFNTASYAANVTAGINQCDYILSELPSYDMGGDRNSASEQAKVEEYYAPFDFSAYQSAINALNSELNQMFLIPFPFDASQTVDSVQHLTPAVMLSDEWFDGNNDGFCDAGGPNCADYGDTDYASVDNGVASVYNSYTTVLNNIISNNNNLRSEVEELRAHLVNIQQDILLLDDQEAALMNSGTVITSELEGVVEDINDAADGIDALIDDMNGIVTFVATAPDYLGCKWIGNFYVNTIKGDFCTDSVDALYNASAPMVAVPALMLICFGFAALYLPVLRDARNTKRNRPKKALADEFDVENTSAANAPPPPALAFVDAVPAADVRASELEMGKIEGGDADSSSTKRKKMTFN